MCYFHALTVHRRIRRGIQTMILCPHKHLSQRVQCYRSSVDRRLHLKRRHTRSTLFTVSHFFRHCKDAKDFVALFVVMYLWCLFTGERPRKLYNERALNLPLGAELITGNIWYDTISLRYYIHLNSVWDVWCFSVLVISSPHPLTLSVRMGQ